MGKLVFAKLVYEKCASSYPTPLAMGTGNAAFPSEVRAQQF